MSEQKMIMTEIGLVFDHKWATSRDWEMLRERFPWINTTEHGYIDPKRSHPEFVAESMEDYYESWEEMLVDVWGEGYTDEMYVEREVTFEYMREVFRIAEQARLSRIPR